MKTYNIVHHKDTDGYLAAAMLTPMLAHINKGESENPLRYIKTLPVAFGNDKQGEVWSFASQPADTLFLLDINFDNDFMNSLASLTSYGDIRRVVLVDHHTGAFGDWKIDNFSDITANSTPRLIHKHFQAILEVIESFEINLLQILANVLWESKIYQAIDRYDNWDFELNGNYFNKEFVIGYISLLNCFDLEQLLYIWTEFPEFCWLETQNKFNIPLDALADIARPFYASQNEAIKKAYLDDIQIYSVNDMEVAVVECKFPGHINQLADIMLYENGYTRVAAVNKKKGKAKINVSFRSKDNSAVTLAEFCGGGGRGDTGGASIPEKEYNKLFKVSSIFG